jgi:hypothetical protein
MAFKNLQIQILEDIASFQQDRDEVTRELAWYPVHARDAVVRRVRAADFLSRVEQAASELSVVTTSAIANKLGEPDTRAGQTAVGCALKSLGYKSSIRTVNGRRVTVYTK